MHRWTSRARRSRRSRWALRGLVAAALLVVIVGALSSVSSTGLQAEILGTIGVLAFTVVGAVILDRRPGEPVGRICLGVGVTYGVATILRLVSSFMDGLPGPITPTGAALAVIGSTARVACPAAERSAADQPVSRSSARSSGSVGSRTCSWRSSA